MGTQEGQMDEIQQLQQRVQEQELIIRDLRGQLMGDADSLSTFEHSLQIQAAMQAKIERLEAIIQERRGLQSSEKLTVGDTAPVPKLMPQCPFVITHGYKQGEGWCHRENVE